MPPSGRNFIPRETTRLNGFAAWWTGKEILYLLSAYCWEEGHAACTCGWNDEELLFTEEPDCLEPVSIAPWDGKSLEDEAVWFRGLLNLAGDEDISPVLPLVYGTGICPECGKREPYWSWLERFMEDY